MPGYRHIQHAGNFADVVKHVVLTALLDTITRKPAPCYVHDSHAGAGVYALDSTEARRKREFDSGILSLWQQTDAPLVVERYLEIVRQWNPGQMAAHFYPGSPAIIRAFLRQQDRLLLTELQPQDHQTLRRQFHNDKRILIHKQDAYRGLQTFLPPVQKHGLVFIDPPYERNDEYDWVVQALRAGHDRWPRGIYAVWYPILSHTQQRRFLEACTATAIRNILHAEFLVAPVTAQRRFTGCGLLLINPPRQIETRIADCLRWLRKPLQGNGDTDSAVTWLVAE